jgi:predicted DNA-binding ribbon-helix-helix protein
MESNIKKRSVTLGLLNTSVSLEEDFWCSLKEIALQREMPIQALVTEIDRRRVQANLSSALRLYALAYYQARTPA